MPRDKKTEARQQQDDLPELNVKEQRLIEALADGCNNTEAYRRAYGEGNYSPAALMVKACRKVAQPHIQEHLRSLRSVGVAKTRLTLDERISDEMAFAQRAEDAGNYGAAGGARDRVNKLLGLYVERYEDITQHDPMATLNEIAQTSPELARELAKQHNIQWQPEDTTQH